MSRPPVRTAASRPTPVLPLAVGAGVAVAGIYYNQPLLGLIERDAGHEAAHLLPAATQFGYAAGLFLLVPLGDLVERRRIVVVQMLVLAAALAGVAVARGTVPLLLASIAVGIAATAAQQIVPFAAALAPAERRGQVVGTVMSGLLCGILLSRMVAGLIGAAWGWRAVFGAAAAGGLGATLVLARILPRHPPAAAERYLPALRSLSALWRSHPALRRATATQGLMFGAFSIFWTTLALHLQEPRFGLGPEAAGLFSLVAATGMLLAPLAGRIADRRGPRPTIRLATLAATASWAALAVPDLAALVAGVILLDAGVQASLVSHQHIIFALDPAARGRINTLFMGGMFLAGGLASAAAMLAWSLAGWTGVCIVGGGTTALAALLALLPARPTNDDAPRTLAGTAAER